MVNLLLFLLAVTTSGSSLSSLDTIQDQLAKQGQLISQLPPISELSAIRAMLEEPQNNLREAVVNKIITTLRCANEYNIERNNILTVIDYSLPSNEKRLWVFDLTEKKLLFHTYVSHGIKSGTLLTNYFSNKYNSKASSLGVYRTNKAYYGREGLSLRLQGLDRNFNDNAENRSVVMHGGWYVDEQFIKRYGRPGRSWGCPALPLNVYQPIINTIKDSSLFIVYYPSDDWFINSKFLNCSSISTTHIPQIKTIPSKVVQTDEDREEILFADLHYNAETEPILAMSADNYEHVFKTVPPLSRMLRRQINNAEYIAISKQEFIQLASQNNQEALGQINFVIPVIIMVRGYAETQMKIVDVGKIKEVQLNKGSLQQISNAIRNFSISLDTSKVVQLKSTNQFIRWLGL